MSEDVKRCPQCGQVVLPPPARMRLSPQQQRIWDAVRERPRSTDELRALLYGSYAIAPADKTLHVVISQLNRRLRPYGVKLRNPQTAYHIIEVNTGMEHSPDQKRSANACSVHQHSRNIDA
jgi:hypothetical protein